MSTAIRDRATCDAVSQSLGQQRLTLMLAAVAVLGIAFIFYAIGESHYHWDLPFLSRYAGLVRLAGLAAVAIAMTVWWPEITLVLLGGGPTHRYILLAPLGVKTGGATFLIEATLLWLISAWILRQRGTFRKLPLAWDWPLLFLAVIGLWIVVYAGLGYTSLGRSEIFDKYVVFSLFSCGGMWYFVCWQLRDRVSSSRSLLWAIMTVNLGGLLTLMWWTTASFSALWDPSSSFWRVTESGSRLTVLGGNPIGVAVEILAPAVTAAFALLLSSSTRMSLKVVLAASLAILCVAMVASGTRQAAIGVLLAMGLVFMFQARARVGRTLVAAGLLAAIAIPIVWSLAPRFEPYGVERFGGLPAALQSWRTDSRVASLEVEAKAIQRRPFTGSGLGITSVNAEAGFGTHNVLSSIAVELGLIPACVTVALLVVLLQCAWRVIRFGDVSTADRPVVLGLVGLFVIAFVGDMASGRMEGGFSFFAWGMPVYFLGRSFLQQNRGTDVEAYQGDMDRAGAGAR